MTMLWLDSCSHSDRYLALLLHAPEQSRDGSKVADAFARLQSTLLLHRAEDLSFATLAAADVRRRSVEVLYCHWMQRCLLTLLTLL